MATVPEQEIGSDVVSVVSSVSVPTCPRRDVLCIQDVLKSVHFGADCGHCVVLEKIII